MDRIAQPRWWQEDHQAAEAARQLWATLRLGIPVPLDDVLWHVGLLLERCHIPAGVRGFLVPEADTIRVNSRLPAWQQRYVIAHEIGHALVHREEIDVRPQRRERICQIFAANLLMPPDIMQQAAQRCYGQADMLEQLMAHFRVSREAACIQLRRLRILPGDPRPRPTVEEHLAAGASFEPLITTDLAPTHVPLMEVDMDAVYHAAPYTTSRRV